MMRAIDILKCLLLHRWEKWELKEKEMVLYTRKGLLGPLDTSAGIPYIEYYQCRYCSRCGKYEEFKLTT